MEIKRMTVAAEFAATKADGSAFTGWASVFGILDQGGDVVQRGAFADDLRERGGTRPMLWQHSHAEPIGSMALQETDKGLRIVEGRIVTEVQRGREAAALLKAGGILGGTSIGYSVVEEGYDRSTGTRLLNRIKLHEVSLVTFPMLLEARIDSVKGDEAKLRDLLRGIRAEIVVARDARERESLDALRGLIAGAKVDATGNELQDMLDALRALKARIR
jgi:uncharacterized protein